MKGEKTGGWASTVGLALGALAPACLPVLPPFAGIVCMGLGGLILLRWRRLHVPALLIIGFCWVAANYHFRIAERLDGPGDGSSVLVEGVIRTVPQRFPEFSRFRFTPTGPGAERLPGSLLVYWYRDRPELAAGQRWALELHLKPPWGAVNFHGPDRERWLFAQGIGGVGSVRSGRLLAPSAGFPGLAQRWRERVLTAVSGQLRDSRMSGFVRALATAETSVLTASDKDLLRRTGTAHLLAISGLHIGLAAAGGAGLGRVLAAVLPILQRGRAAYFMTLGCSLLAGLAYAALAGFGVATQRAILMLVCVLAALGMSRAMQPFRAWLLALSAVLLLDPFAALGPGFWFSFLAVAALLLQFAPRAGRERWWATPFRAQWAVMLALAPVTATWFQMFSPAAFPANLIAVPWVSLLVVPFVLGGVAVMEVSLGFAGALWSLAAWFLAGILNYLSWLDAWQGYPWQMPAPSRLHVVLALAGALLLLLPRGFSIRWLGCFFLLPLFLPPATGDSDQGIDLDVLDVGQGTAALVRVGGKTLLYDSGPGDGRGFDRVASAIAPALTARGLSSPDRVVISHADLDHAGGLHSLLRRYPQALYTVNHPDEPPWLGGCTRELDWRWRDTEFRVLHPTPALPYRGNDSSCVISVRAPGSALLLSGDISEAIERRLLAEGLEGHLVVLVPHHGSPTSSGAAFIARLEPEVAVATAGLGNRFDFPREAVRRRYLEAGAAFWSTGACGGLRLNLGRDGRVRAESARRVRDRPWRWPAAPECP